MEFLKVKQKNIGQYPQVQLEPCYCFQVSEPLEDIPEKLTAKQVELILAVIKNKIQGKRSDVVISIGKYPKVEVFIAPGPDLDPEDIGTGKYTEYEEVYQLLESCDFDKSTVVTFLNKTKRKVKYEICALP